MDERDEPTPTEPLADSGGATAATPERDPQVGDVLGGRYALIDAIGKGGMGRVFRAHDRVADETVAVKCLHAKAASSHTLERLRRELRAARMIIHPNVVRIFDLVDADGQLLLSMELVDGEDLSQRLRKSSRLPADVIAGLLRDLSAGLAAAHAAGVVHRDLKPGNVIVRKDGVALLTDFGISRLGFEADSTTGETTPSSDAQLTREGDLLGTPTYMSPEQLRRQRAGPSADVYALGLVLWEAATGALPFDDPLYDLVTGTAKRLTQDPPPLSSLRPDLASRVAQTIDRCLRHDPAQRFPDGGAIVLALADRRPRRRRRARLIWISACIALLAGGGGLHHHWSGRLPAADRRVAIEVSGQGADEAWLARATQGLLRRRMAARERRVHVATQPKEANVTLAVHVARAGRGVELDASLGPVGGRLTPLPRVAAASVSDGVDELLRRAAPLYEGQSEPPPGPAEVAHMEAIGARSREAVKLYETSIDELFGAVNYDRLAFKARGERILKLDPAWPHAHALLLQEEWPDTPEWRSLQERLKVSPHEPGRDPAGEAMLASLREPDLQAGEKHAAALEAQYARHPEDALLGWQLSERVMQARKREAQLAVLHKLHAARPELQFGADIVRLLREDARDGEAEALIERWIVSAPESEQALASRVGLDLRRGRFADAWRGAEDLVLVHGEASHRLATLCDVLMAGDRLREARDVAARLLAGDDLARVRGKRRLGEIAILEGRFEAAWSSLEEALALGRPHGLAGETLLTLESLRAIAPLVQRKDAVPRLVEELEGLVRQVGDLGTAAALAAERRPAGPCPPARELDRLRGEDRAVADVHLQRARAEAGCAPCADVTAAGVIQSSERSTRSLLRLGACFEATGQSDRALDVYRTAEQQWLSLLIDGGAHLASSYHVTIARYRTARTQLRAGHPDRARAGLAAFVDRWGKADHPPPEVADARAALGRLK